MEILTFYTFCDSGFAKVSRNNYSYRHLGELSRQSEEKLEITLFHEKSQNVSKKSLNRKIHMDFPNLHFAAPLCLIYCRSNDKWIVLDGRNRKKCNFTEFLCFLEENQFSTENVKK